MLNHMPLHYRRSLCVSLLIGLCMQAPISSRAQENPSSDAERLMQNGAQEKLTAQWVNRALQLLAAR